MFGFNYISFKEAIKRAQDEKYAMLMEDIEKVKAVVEKGLALVLECSTSKTRAAYPGVDI